MTNPGATDGRDLCGELLDSRYRVESKLGAGGMAIVYLATDERLGRQVVIKAPLEIFLTVHGFRERFAQEIQALIQLDNPFIGKILDMGEVDGLPYAVLQYLAGGSLKERVDASGGSLTPLQLREWLPRVARALDFIHSREFLHRDIKPGNILFDADGNVYIADFGIAKVLGDKEFTNLTQTGTLPGTVAYMAPEAGRGGTPGPAYDQYALAVVVYQALTGDLPHEICETPIAGLVQKITQNPIPIEQVRSHLPIGVCRCVMKALSGEPDERFDSCHEFAQEFLAGIDTDPAIALIEDEVDQSALETVRLPPREPQSPPAADAQATIITGEQPTDVDAERLAATSAEQTVITGEQPVEPEQEPQATGVEPEHEGAEPEAAAPEPQAVEAEPEEEPALHAAPVDPDVEAVDPDQSVVMPDPDQFAPPEPRPPRWQLTAPKLPSWQLPTISMPRVDLSRWQKLLADPDTKKKLVIGAGGVVAVLVVVLLVMAVMANRAGRAQRIATLQEAVQNAIDTRDWDAADQQLAELTVVAPSNAAATGWRRVIDDGRRIERSEALRQGIVASIVGERWDEAAAQIVELEAVSPQHPQLETFKQRTSEGDPLALAAALAAAVAGGEAQPGDTPPAEPQAPPQAAQPQAGPEPAAEPADDPAPRQTPAAAEPEPDPPAGDDPPAADDPPTAGDPPAGDDPPVTEELTEEVVEEAAPAPVSETRPPVRLSAAAPAYPEVPFALGIEGDVTVEATIDVEGNVSRATVPNSLDPFLDEAAIDAVLQWKYEPALVNGAPREYPLTATLTFAMPAGDAPAPVENREIEEARQLDTMRFLTDLVGDLDQFHAVNSFYPETLAELPAAVLQDSWNTPFWYKNLGDEYWLVSFGRDGRPGPRPPDDWALGTAVDADIRVHTGDFDRNPAEPPDAAPTPPSAGVAGVVPVPLTAAMTAPRLDPESVDIIVDRQVRDTIGLTTRRVQVYCLVMDDGSVIEARVLQVDPGISLASADASFKATTRQSAIDTWRFSPALRDGEPVPVWFLVTIAYEPRR